MDESNLTALPKSPSPAGGFASEVTEIALEETASTNAHALELLGSGAAPQHLTLVWAQRQTKGRGRGGRVWQSAEGNVFFSMILRLLQGVVHLKDLKRPQEQQDKRMVVILPGAQYEEWLDAPAERSRDFLSQFPAERLVMTPEPLPPREPKAAKRARAQLKVPRRRSRRCSECSAASRVELCPRLVRDSSFGEEWDFHYYVFPRKETDGHGGLCRGSSEGRVLLQAAAGEVAQEQGRLAR
ncbi:hypothetical protein J7E70_12200 [Variovorax paradoxus]|nr:hypothetical protein [Variovorax paradoxus]MBT2301223.1 hypothetical protein [Variovorax paradoxus]